MNQPDLLIPEGVYLFSVSSIRRDVTRHFSEERKTKISKFVVTGCFADINKEITFSTLIIPTLRASVYSLLKVTHQEGMHSYYFVTATPQTKKDGTVLPIHPLSRHNLENT